jgi:hypothetical protein
MTYVEQEVSRVELEEARPNRESVLFSDTEFSRVELNSEILDAVENEVEAEVESPARSEVLHGFIKSIASIKEFSMEESHLNNDSFSKNETLDIAEAYNIESDLKTQDEKKKQTMNWLKMMLSVKRMQNNLKSWQKFHY